MNNQITTPLGSLAQIINGRAYKQQELLDSGKYRVLRVGNFFSNGSWYFSDLELDKDKYCESGDLLFAWSASFGPKIWNDEKVIYHYHIWKIVENPKLIDRSFLYYFLLNSVKGMMASTHGSIMLHLTKEYMERLPVRFPEDLTVQKNIATVLSSIDAKINCNHQINNELRLLAKTLYDLWFIQYDFPNADGKPYKSSGGLMVYNDILKREIPAGWSLKNLCDIANITMGTSPPGESLNESNEGVEFFQGSTDFGWQFPTTRQYTSAPIRKAKKGDILLSVRAPVGDMNIAHIDCCIGRGLAALNSKDGFDGFLFYVMQYFKTIFDRRNSEGTTFGSITKNDLHSLPLAYPTPDVLIAFNDIVSKYNKAVFNRSMENQQLIQLRDWLLPMLMNGQVTVSN